MPPFIIGSLLFVSLLSLSSSDKIGENELKAYLKESYEKEATDYCYKVNEAEFVYVTDVNNKEKEESSKNETIKAATWTKEVWKKYIKDITPNDFKDPELKRQIKDMTNLGTAALDEEKLKKYTDLTSKMTAIYSSGKICPYKKQDCDLKTEGLTLEPGIEKIMQSSRDYDELAYAWKAWRDASGAKIKPLFSTYVELSNEAAKINNFTDKGASWRDAYEDPDFIKHIDELWTQLEPLYLELHKYASKKLKAQYGDKLDISDGLLPAHIFGNMWAQSWDNIVEILLPFPNATKIDLDAAMLKQNYTVLDMFKASNDFYTSLGLIPNDRCYDVSKGAMIEKPKDGRDVLCHASAWDFCDGETYRVKMCTKVGFEDFIVIHHEMGHIEYFQLYKKQPYNFRNGANPGFHEAVGDTIALSVSTPKHLKKIKLVDDYVSSQEESLNSLMRKAMGKVAFLPFGLLIDKWRWDVFSGSVPEQKWNSHWWDLRAKYQKIKAPVPRSDEKDFDPAAKYHVAGDSQYIAYFVAHILQFQFYKSLCISAGEYNPTDKNVPLHECDFYQSKAAGDKLRDGLSLGSSKHWSDVLEIMTGERQLNAQPVLEYFEPLYEYLKQYNKNSATDDVKVTALV